MTNRVFFLNRLRPGVTKASYERWVREVDYPTAGSIPSIRSYKVHRLEGAFEGEPPYDYIEVVEVTDLEAYRKDLQTPDLKGFGEQWSGYVGESTAVYGELIE